MKGNDVERLRKKGEEHQGSGEYLVYHNIWTIKYSGRQKERDWVRRNQDVRPLGNMNVQGEGHWMNAFPTWGTSTFMSPKNMNVFIEMVKTPESGIQWISLQEMGAFS